MYILVMLLIFSLVLLLFIRLRGVDRCLEGSYLWVTRKAVFSMLALCALGLKCFLRRVVDTLGRTGVPRSEGVIWMLLMMDWV